MEVGADYCLYAFADVHHKSVHNINYVTFDEFAAEESLQKIMDELKQHTFSKAILSSAFPYALLMHQRQFRGDYDLLNAVYDRPGQYYLFDRINEWQIVNMHAMPSSVYSIVNSLPDAKWYHVYSTSLKIYNGFAGGDQVTIHFNTQTFRALVKKDNQVQLAQTYTYKTPLDVVYYLLKIFSEFSLDQKEAYLILSGLVQEDSALYKELHSYFENLHFAHAPMIALPATDHPHHYFTSIYNLAACES